MVEDDTFTYHVKRQPAGRTDTAAQSLITKERMQKLDLLIHLLSNLPQALVVCGPNGIGKTTLLTVLQERKTESWQYCFLQGNANLSFEAVQAQLIMAHQPVPKNQGQTKQVVLIVDNAGELVPGLISAIIHYATANPVLRVVFALTHDELQVKRGSDRVIDDCHIIEIPTLSEKQSGDFLRYLSTKPALNVSFKAVSDNMIAHIYRETHGVPGKIITEVSSLSGVKATGHLKWILIPIPVILALILGVYWLMPPVNPPLPPASVPPNNKTTEPKIIGQQTVPPAPIALALPPSQPTVQQPVPPVETSAQEAIAQKDNQQPTISTEKPETVVISQLETIQPSIIEPLVEQEKPIAASPASQEAYKPAAAVQQKIIEPLAIPEEKPKQLTVKSVAATIDKKSAIKTQIEPIPEPGTVQNPANSEPDGTKMTMAERLWAKQQQLKQAELSKTLDNIEPPTANIAPQQPTKTEETSEKPKITAEDNSKSPPAPQRGNFTLQLMVLSKQASANTMLNKYPAMRPDISVVQMIIKGQGKFVLNYGSYPDAVSANKARQSLPFEFHNALVRKISSAEAR